MELNLKLRNDVWQVHGTVMLPDGAKVRVRKSTGFPKHLKNLASAELNKIAADALAGRMSAKSVADNVTDAIRLYVSRPNPPGATDVTTLERFGRTFGHVPLDSVNVTDIQRYVQGRGNKANTVAREINSINAMFKYAKDMGLPVDLVLKKPAVDDARLRWLNEADRDRLIDCADPAIKAELVFLFFTGARLGEMFKLTWADIVDGKAMLRSKKGRTKRTKTRAIPLTADVLDVLPVQAGQHVFTNPSGNVWERTAFYAYFKPACARAGIADFTPHDCRHTFASLLVQRGASLRAVADLLGHSSLAMVMRYSHLAPSHLEDAVSLLGCRGTNVAHQ